MRRVRLFIYDAGLFDVCNDEGGGDVKDRVDTADDKCVMGGGKCVTHNVKLKRTEYLIINLFYGPSNHVPMKISKF